MFVRVEPKEPNSDVFERIKALMMEIKIAEKRLAMMRKALLESENMIKWFVEDLPFLVQLFIVIAILNGLYDVALQFANHTCR